MYIRVCVCVHTIQGHMNMDTENVEIKKIHTHTLEYHSTQLIQEMLPRDDVNGPEVIMLI